VVAYSDFASHGVDSLRRQHPGHNLIQERGHNAAVGYARPALMVTLGREMANVLVILEVEIGQVQAMRILRPTSKTPLVISQRQIVTLHVVSPHADGKIKQPPDQPGGYCCDGTRFLASARLAADFGDLYRADDLGRGCLSRHYLISYSIINYRHSLMQQPGRPPVGLELLDVHLPVKQRIVN